MSAQLISIVYGALGLALVDRSLDFVLQALELVRVRDLNRGLFVEEHSRGAAKFTKGSDLRGTGLAMLSF